MRGELGAKADMANETGQSGSLMSLTAKNVLSLIGGYHGSLDREELITVEGCYAG